MIQVWGSIMIHAVPSIQFTIVFSVCKAALVKDHDTRFNPRGIKRGGEETQQDGGDNAGPERKRLCLEKSMALSDESLIEDKTLSII